MALFRISFVLLSAVFTARRAAAQDDTVTVWGVAAYVMYGERTPLIGPTSPELTPLGAQQMFTQGSAFRERYLLAGTPESNVSALLPIVDLEPNSLNSDHVSIITTMDTYVAAGAQAFIQGLYPPQTDQFAYGNGGSAAADLVNGTHIDFPLGGYQYPLIHTVSLTDPTSSFIEGHTACTNYQASILTNFRNDTIVQGTYNSTLDFYQTLAPTVFDGVFSDSMTNFYNAYDLYDYASYAASHDSQVASAINASDLEILGYLATVQQLDLNANLSISGAQEGDMIRAVSGRMLATQIVNMFAESVSKEGNSKKLSLLFGSFEPILAFFALSGLLSGPYKSAFENHLPGPGGAMIFELYSTTPSTLGADNASLYPSTDDLYVRFYYQLSYDRDDGPPNQYGLFTNSTSDFTMSYTSFVNAMRAVGIATGAAWCETCNSASIFCPGLEQNAGFGASGGSSSSSNGGSVSKGGVAPAVAGVIGALVALSIVALIVLAAALLGGLRFYFTGKNSAKDIDGDDAAVGGGFKGPERKVPDPDMAVTKTGAHHERVGSWELRAGPPEGGGAVVSSTTATAGAVDASQDDSSDSTDGGRTKRVQSTIEDHLPDDDDEIMADMSSRPVDPREHF